MCFITGNGVIDFQEFLSMMSKKQNDNPEDELKEAFKVTLTSWLHLNITFNKISVIEVYNILYNTDAIGDTFFWDNICRCDFFFIWVKNIL